MKFIRAAIVTGWLLSPGAAVAEDDIARLQRLLDAGEPAQAYALAQSLQRDLGHDSDFLYLYGQAALAHGRSGEAAFAFEEAVLGRPDHHEARLALTRIYFDENRMELAEQELRALLDRAPPAAIAAEAASLLKEATSNRAGFRGFLGLGMGYENGLNRSAGAWSPATASAVVFIDPDAPARQVGGSGPDLGLNPRLLGETHAPAGWSGFETGNFPDRTGAELVNVFGAGGVQWGRNGFAIPVAHQELLVDYDKYLQSNSLGVEWRHQWDGQNLFNLAARYGDVSYESDNPYRTTSLLAAVGWSGEYATAFTPRLGGSVYLGEESVNEEELRYFGRRYYGFTLDGSVSPYRNHSPYVSFRYQWSDYADTDPVHLIARTEDYSRLAAGWDWHLAPNLRLRAEADYTVNSSNLSLYEYDRNRLFFSTRFDFR